jgi:hypothetical protein
MSRLQVVTEAAATKTMSRPVDRWVQDKLPEIVDEAEDALIKSGLRIYQRAGFLVRVVRRATRRACGTTSAAAWLRSASSRSTSRTHRALTRAARWQKWNAKAKKPKDPKGGRWVPMHGAERRRRRTSRAAATGSCRAVVGDQLPTLRPDGTVLQEPGYDKKHAELVRPVRHRRSQDPGIADARDAEARSSARRVRLVSVRDEVDRRWRSRSRSRRSCAAACRLRRWAASRRR